MNAADIAFRSCTTPSCGYQEPRGSRLGDFVNGKFVCPMCYLRACNHTCDRGAGTTSRTACGPCHGRYSRVQESRVRGIDRLTWMLVFAHAQAKEFVRVLQFLRTRLKHPDCCTCYARIKGYES